ncbi:hypothetical protein ACLOJK_003642 [Asimina triloba]
MKIAKAKPSNINTTTQHRSLQNSLRKRTHAKSIPPPNLSVSVSDMSISRIFSSSCSSSSSSRFFSFHGGISSSHRPTPFSPIPSAFLTKPHYAAYFRSHPLFRKQSVSEFSSSAPSKTGFVAWYLGLLEVRPILTKAVTAGIIYTAADVSSQARHRHRKLSLFPL